MDVVKNRVTKTTIPTTEAIVQGDSKPHGALQESKVSYSSTFGCCFELPSSIARIGTAAVLVVGGVGCSML